jgi:hypothetical protein
VTTTVVETTVDRLAGRRPSRMRALFVACVAAVGAGTVVYKLLRSEGGPDDEGS